MNVRRQFPPAPTTARALVIHGHPRQDSFNHALAEAWADGARQGGVSVDSVNLSELDFAPWYQEQMALEPDLARVQRLIAEAGHITLGFPVWWGSTPALLKAFFDRAFETGWAYGRTDEGGYVRGLNGRSGRLIVTMDAPSWYDRIVYGRSAIRQVRDATFHFCGIRPAKVSAFFAIDKTTQGSRDAMLTRARAAGGTDARALRRRLPRAKNTRSLAAG